MPGNLEKSIVPAEFGRAFEAYEVPTNIKIVRIAMLFVLCVAAFVIPFKGFDWVDMWFPWVFIVGLTALQARRIRDDRVLAGARWVQQRDEWVATYELTKIRSTTVGLYRAMKIEDVHGHKLVLVLHDTQTNPRLWDFVYNGIIHSVAFGNCDISKAARRILKI